MRKSNNGRREISIVKYKDKNNYDDDYDDENEFMLDVDDIFSDDVIPKKSRNVNSVVKADTKQVRNREPIQYDESPLRMGQKNHLIINKNRGRVNDDSDDDFDYSNELSREKPEYRDDAVAAAFFNLDDRENIISNRSAKPVIFGKNKDRKYKEAKKYENLDINFDDTRLNAKRFGEGTKNFKNIEPYKNFELSDNQNMLLEKSFNIDDIIGEDENSYIVRKGLVEASEHIDTDTSFYSSALFRFIRTHVNDICKSIDKFYKNGAVPNDVKKFIEWLNSAVRNNDPIAGYEDLLTLFNEIFMTNKNAEDIINLMGFYIQVFHSSIQRKQIRQDKVKEFNSLLATLQSVAKQTVFLSSNFGIVVDAVNGLQNTVKYMDTVNEDVLGYMTMMLRRINELQDSSNTTIENVSEINGGLTSLENELTEEISAIKNDMENLQMNFELEKREIDMFKYIFQITSGSEEKMNFLRNGLSELLNTISGYKKRGFSKIQQKVLAGILSKFGLKIKQIINDKAKNIDERVYEEMKEIYQYIEEQEQKMGGILKKAFLQHNQLAQNVKNITVQFNQTKKTYDEQFEELNAKYKNLDSRVSTIEKDGEDIMRGVCSIARNVNSHDERLNTMNAAIEEMENNTKKRFDAQQQQINSLKGDIDNLKKDFDAFKNDRNITKDTTGVTEVNHAPNSYAIEKVSNPTQPVVYQTVGTSSGPEYNYDRKEDYYTQSIDVLKQFDSIDPNEHAQKVATGIELLFNFITNRSQASWCGYKKKENPAEDLKFLLQLILTATKVLLDSHKWRNPTVIQMYTNQAINLINSLCNRVDVSSDIETLVKKFVEALRILKVNTNKPGAPIVIEVGRDNPRIMTFSERHAQLHRDTGNQVTIGVPATNTKNNIHGFR